MGRQPLLVVEAERRQLTVMFCDLVDSTALAGRLDPEELRDLIRAYQQACADVIARFDGHIAQYLGDGVLVYFGYPQAHEDDAPRAVRAGLGMVDAIGGLNQRMRDRDGVRLAVRIGIHTGLVVVGEVGGGGRHEQLALGDTPNLAARLQALAGPDVVVISAATHRLVQDLFVARDLGAQSLKGVAAPVQVHQVVAEATARSRLDGTATTALTPLVGREQELGLLLDRWEQVLDGRGQVVLLSGEAGIGKSRLVKVLKERVAEPQGTLECRGSPYSQHSPLHPVIELLTRLLGWARDTEPEARFATLERFLASHGLDRPEPVLLLASVLSLPVPDGHSPLSMSAERQRKRTLETLVAVVLAVSGRQPILLIVEDLHWVDPTTLEWLGLLLDQAPTARLLTLLTARPAFQVPWAPRAHLAVLTLNRLTRLQTDRMVGHVAGHKPLPAEVLQQIVGKTDGVPLFVEELTKMVLESGLVRETSDRYELAGPLPPLAIPATLQDSLMARLDRLASVKQVAQLGATLGRAFPYAVLRAVAQLDEAALQRDLGRLVEAELLYQRGVPPEATYLFKHALIQDAAYQSLLKATRQQYHQRIAQVVEEQFPETVETQPELLAHHYTAASLPTQAIGYWQRAGERAMGRSAYAEAISHVTKGLELLQALPETPERIERECMLQMALGVSLTNTRGPAAPEVGPVFRRARQLAQQTVDTPQLVLVLYGLWSFHLTRAEYQAALELGNDAPGFAQSLQDPAFLVVAHGMLGVALLYSGDITAALDHFDQGAALYDRQQHHVFVSFCGRDPGVEHWTHAATALWFLGYPDQGRARMHEAIVLAQELSHPFSLAFGLLLATLDHVYRREIQSTREQARATMTIASEQGFAFPLAWATFFDGWVLTEDGRDGQGIAQMRQAQTSLRAIGVEVATSWRLGMIAEAHGKLGETDAGLTVLADAWAFAHKSNERLWEAELYRIEGELLRQGTDQSQSYGSATPRGGAEACFQQAIDVARHQRAKSLELRAVLSLSRLWREQGKTEEARRLLAEIYGWFTEGFDTPDLQDAKALLDELAKGRG